MDKEKAMELLYACANKKEFYGYGITDKPKPINWEYSYDSHTSKIYIDKNYGKASDKTLSVFCNMVNETAQSIEDSLKLPSIKVPSVIIFYFTDGGNITLNRITGSCENMQIHEETVKYKLGWRKLQVTFKAYNYVKEFSFNISSDGEFLCNISLEEAMKLFELIKANSERFRTAEIEYLLSKRIKQYAR